MEFLTMCMLAAGFGMAIGAFGTGIGQGMAVARAVEGVSRNPGASGKILVQSILAMALAEGLGLLALLIAKSA